MSLRTGITTGTCATAAAKAAAMVLRGLPVPAQVEVALPGGKTIAVDVLYARRDGERGVAAVRKDGGDDPDVTHGLEIVAAVSWRGTAFQAVPSGQAGSLSHVEFRAGEGVGSVTKPGLQVPPGEPAINPVPRAMIRQALREVTDRPICVEISIPGGREIAAKTFNPRLGIVGGLSILGTTGIVRPYCTQALRDALKCALDVASACGVTCPVLVPGNIGARGARGMFALRDEQVIEVSNEWGFVLELARGYSFERLLVVGHPGKLAKLAAGDWDTHSARSGSPVAPVGELWREVFGSDAPESPTVEGLFAVAEGTRLGDALSVKIRAAVEGKTGRPAAVVLVNMQGRCIGSDGDLTTWR